jgi:hypothetical protein
LQVKECNGGGRTSSPRNLNGISVLSHYISRRDSLALLHTKVDVTLFSSDIDFSLNYIAEPVKRYLYGQEWMHRWNTSLVLVARANKIVKSPWISFYESYILSKACLVSYTENKLLAGTNCRSIRYYCAVRQDCFTIYIIRVFTSNIQHST